jgi:acyl dehydratase
VRAETAEERVEAAEVIDYRVVAHNSSTASENRIHADDVARRYGFRGGLVPGVTVYGYAAHAVLQALGSRWVERGVTRIRFLTPCYDGEELVVSVTRPEFVVRSGERNCVVGSASLSNAEPGGVEVAPIPAAPVPEPEDRPAAGRDSLCPGAVLGSVTLDTDPATCAAYLARIGEPSRLYAEDGIVHPALLLEGANRVLMVNVVLPAWLHVESEVRHLRAVSVGEDVEVRSRVAEVFERKGHHFVRLDVVWLAGDEPVAAAQHTAIWQLAGS